MQFLLDDCERNPRFRVNGAPDPSESAPSGRHREGVRLFGAPGRDPDRFLRRSVIPIRSFRGGRSLSGPPEGSRLRLRRLRFLQKRIPVPVPVLDNQDRTRRFLSLPSFWRAMAQIENCCKNAGAFDRLNSSPIKYTLHQRKRGVYAKCKNVPCRVRDL